MKNVYLLPDEGSHWGKIEGYLKSVNANIVRFQADFDLRDLKKVPPDIFVVSEESNFGLLRYQLRNHVMIIVGDRGRVPGTVTPSPNNPKVVTVNWPMTCEAFLKLSAELSKLSERRVFRTLLRIFPDGSSTPSIGLSMDFSHSGMALKTKEKLAIGARAEVSLSLPNMDESTRLPIQVMRSTGEGEEISYGAQFVGLDKARQMILDKFILQE